MIQKARKAGFLGRTKLILVVGLVLVSFAGVKNSLAGEHPLSTITGTEIDLKVYDHAFGGSIKDFVVWGDVNEEHFVSRLIMRRDGQTIEAQFKKQEDGKLGGTIQHTYNDVVRETVISLDRVIPSESKIRLVMSGQALEVNIEADAFANRHFENPTYKVAYTDTDGVAKELSYSLKGHACYGYSLHMAFLILGAYFH